MYVAYKLGAEPYFNAILLCGATLIQKTYQIHLLGKLASFDVYAYLKESVRPVLITLAVTLPPLLLVKYAITFSTIGLIIFIILYEVWIVVAIYLFGLKQGEKMQIINFVKSKVLKKSV